MKVRIAYIEELPFSSVRRPLLGTRQVSPQRGKGDGTDRCTDRICTTEGPEPIATKARMQSPVQVRRDACCRQSGETNLDKCYWLSQAEDHCPLTSRYESQSFGLERALDSGALGHTSRNRG